MVTLSRPPSLCSPAYEKLNAVHESTKREAPWSVGPIMWRFLTSNCGQPGGRVAWGSPAPVVWVPCQARVSFPIQDPEPLAIDNEQWTSQNKRQLKINKRKVFVWFIFHLFCILQARPSPAPPTHSTPTIYYVLYTISYHICTMYDVVHIHTYICYTTYTVVCTVYYTIVL